MSKGNCKNICYHWPGHSRYMYMQGYTFCKRCDKCPPFNDDDSIPNFCPCCGNKVRHAPLRSMSYNPDYEVRI